MAGGQGIGEACPFDAYSKSKLSYFSPSVDYSPFQTKRPIKALYSCRINQLLEREYKAKAFR